MLKVLWSDRVGAGWIVLLPTGDSWLVPHQLGGWNYKVRMKGPQSRAVEVDLPSPLLEWLGIGLDLGRSY